MHHFRKIPITLQLSLVAMTVAVALSLCLIGCAEVQGPGRKVSYMETARSNFKRGQAELKNEDYLAAIKFFQYVKNKFPFSRYSTLAELRTADAHFAQEKYLEAIDAYKLFIKFHPIHPEVKSGYVSYKICQSYVEQIPSDWFLVPPSHEKDQSATKDALRELLVFKRVFPKSKYQSQVKDLFRRCTHRLAAHEMYVARFYLDQGKPMGAIMRLETLLARYPEAGVDPEVLLLLGKTYIRMKKKEAAKKAMASLIEKYPDSPYSAKAQLYLKLLSGQRE